MWAGIFLNKRRAEISAGFELAPGVKVQRVQLAPGSIYGIFMLQKVRFEGTGIFDYMLCDNFA